MSNNVRQPQRVYVCPWWLMYFADHRLRRLVQPPDPVIEPLVAAGDSCLDIGCGMGYFTIPLARRVGPTGHVTAVDLQPRMLQGAARRARREGLTDRISFCLVTESSWAAAGQYDFILAMWMLHEVPDQRSFLADLRKVIKAGGRFLLIEPRLHVREQQWQESLTLARGVGFGSCTPRHVRFSRAAVLQ